MSSILKALEKVEESQNGKRSGGAAGLSRRRERRPAWLIPAWAVGGAAAASLITFAIMGGFSRSTSAVPQPIAKSANPAPAPVASVPAPAANKVEAPVQKTAATSVSKPAASAVRKTASTTAKSARLPQVPAASPAPARPVAVPVPAVVATVPAADVQDVVAEKPRQEIRVTGIAWQGNSESSFAMVNGRAIRQGGTVDGFKVERIFEDSVKLSGSAGSVTVPLGAGE